MIEIGCGRGDLVRLLERDGYDAESVDIGPEHTALTQAAGITRVRHGDFCAMLAAHPNHTAITATDLLKHFTKPGILATFDDVAASLMPGGVFVARVPNAVSPLAGHIRNGDFTHQTSFMARSTRRFTAAASFDVVLAQPCPAISHRLASAARGLIWQAVRAWYRIALAAETGTPRGHIVSQNLTATATPSKS